MKEGNAELLADAAQLAAHPKPQVGVKRAEGLVEKHEFWTDHQRPGESDALFLSARDLVDGAVLEASEAHELKHFQRARARLIFGRRLRAIAQTESDIVEHREVRKEREILKDEADVPEIGRTGGDVLALQENASALQRLETRDCAQQHGLARAARAEERYILAGVNRERNVVERRALGKKLGQAFQSQNRNFGHGLSHGSNGLRRRQGAHWSLPACSCLPSRE